MTRPRSTGPNHRLGRTDPLRVVGSRTDRSDNRRDGSGHSVDFRHPFGGGAIVNLKTYVAAVRFHWRTFILATAMVLILGLAAILLSPKRFVSTTQLMVSIDGGETWMTEETGFGPAVTMWLSLIRTPAGQKQLFAFTHGRGAWR